MLAYNIVTAICLLLMGMCMSSVIAKIALTYKHNQREERIEYLREYKRGRMVLIYICVFPLLLAGLLYEGRPFFNALTGAVATIIDIVVLKFDPSAFSGLMGDSKLFEASIYISDILIALNAGMFVWSIVGQYISNMVSNLAVNRSKEKVVIFGNNEHSHTIYNSEVRRKKVVVDQIKGDDAKALYVKDIVYCNVSNNEKYIEKLVSGCVKRKERVYAVINTENDESNIELARQFSASIKKLDQESQLEVFDLMRVYVFGDPRFEAIYEDVVKGSLGCVSYINKYQKMAVDFVDKYPFTRFMDSKHIDYASSCVKDDVDINAIMIGFGKTNQQIFLTSVANNQFITKGENRVAVEKVKYHLFDKSFKDKDGHADSCDANDKNLNHNYFRFRNECANVNGDDYLDLPEYPAEEHFHHLDVNDQDFYNEIRKVLTRSEKDANFIIIAFGNDLENVDMAEKLASKIKEWGVSNAIVFVKIRGEHGDNKYCDKPYYPICSEDMSVYDIEKIIGDKIFNMALLRDEVYALEYKVSSSSKALSQEDIDKVKEEAHRNWFTSKTPNERESNIYCVLSLRSKLNMMGLDYCRVEDEGEALDQEEYLSLYAGDDMPDTTTFPITADGKHIVTYTLDFAKSRRGDMAVHEHYRWNSFMITKGFIPATKSAIVNEVNEKGKCTNGKNYSLRRHGNLTTFDGLVEFRRLVARRDMNKGETMEEAEARKDVIKYDYQLLDDAHWLLTKTGHKIIRRN